MLRIASWKKREFQNAKLTGPQWGQLDLEECWGVHSIKRWQNETNNKYWMGRRLARYRFVFQTLRASSDHIMAHEEYNENNIKGKIMVSRSLCGSGIRIQVLWSWIWLDLIADETPDIANAEQKDKIWPSNGSILQQIEKVFPNAINARSTSIGHGFHTCLQRLITTKRDVMLACCISHHRGKEISWKGWDGSRWIFCPNPSLY